MKFRILRYWILAADLLWIVCAVAFAVEIRYANAGGSSFRQHLAVYTFMTVVSCLAWTLIYFEMKLDGFQGGWHLPAILSKLIVAVCLMMMSVLTAAFLIQHYYSRLVLLYFSLLFTFGLIGIRCLVRLLVVSYRRTGGGPRCIILGNGPVARELVAKIESHPEVPFKVVGFLSPGEPEILKRNSMLPSRVTTAIKTLQVLDLLAQEKVRKLIIVMSQPNNAEIRKLISECRKSAIQVYLVPQWYDLYVSKAELIEIDGLPLVSLQERSPSIPGFTLKRFMDISIGTCMLLLSGPVLLAAAAFVYAKKGRAFRTELRCGKDSIPFRMYRLNIERHSPQALSYERLFIRWSLTELPQLWNVVRGDMSLVGPRPESAERLKHYSDWQRQRLKVRGGVTGLAQVHGLREQHSSEDKARFDLQYIFNWSPFLDLSLILQTIWTLLVRGLNQEPAPAQSDSPRAATEEYIPESVADANRP